MKYLTKEDIEECLEELYKYDSTENHYAQKDFIKALEARVILRIHEKGFWWVGHAKQLSLLSGE